MSSINADTQSRLFNIRLSRLKQLLFDQTNTNSVRDPQTDVPKNHYDEIFDNCLLGDAYVFKEIDLKITSDMKRYI